MMVTNASNDTKTLNEVNKVETVYQRVAAYKIKTGVTYTFLAKQCGISQGVMEKLTGKSRRMTEANLNKLVTYLDSVGA